MFEDIKLSFKGIWLHKLRSFLTMLGIIVGVAAVIVIVLFPVAVVYPSFVIWKYTVVVPTSVLVGAVVEFIAFCAVPYFIVVPVGDVTFNVIPCA